MVSRAARAAEARGKDGTEVLTLRMNPATEAAVERRPNRRRHERRPVSQEVRITVLCPRLWPEIHGTSVDESEGGMGLLVEQPITRGCTLQIRVNGAVIVGEVRHLNAAGDKYHIGVALTGIYRSGRASDSAGPEAPAPDSAVA
jgi:c-di-GMP-binding flagellar brake protein YcgR